jgi:hypothetical protein
MKKNQAHDSSLKIGREKKKMAEQELAYWGWKFVENVEHRRNLNLIEEQGMLCSNSHISSYNHWNQAKIAQWKDETEEKKINRY